ncbi:MAG: hypothetical protein KME04_15040 [Pleurocapsa minor GSE-CHR-MK-17-07R]|jgi:predicted dienelactone hydrolase|nr:hypothetical protein [Pleurocapsa minor GSE-CHR-MK 17-07R]
MSMNRTFSLFSILIFVMVLSNRALAQQVTYENDDFSVQVPFDWDNTSTDTLARATDRETGATFYVTAASTMEESLAAAEITVSGDPVETTTVLLPSGEWEQAVYIVGEQLTILWTLMSDQSYLMAATAPLSAVDTATPLIQASLASFQITGQTPSPFAGTMFTYPAVSGPYGVGRSEYTWTDSAREEIYTPEPEDYREVAVTVWYPAQTDHETSRAPWLAPQTAVVYAAMTGIPFETISMVQINAAGDALIADAAAPFPVLIMSHGDGLLPALYTSFAESLASQGYVVFGLAHPYNAAAVAFPDGRVVTALPEASAQPSNSQPGLSLLEIAQIVDSQGRAVVTVLAADIRFALDQIELLNAEDARFTGRLDLERVGVFGHSIGGAASIEAMLTDPRIDATVNLDGTVFSDVDGGSNRPTLTIATQFQDLSVVSDDMLAGMGISRADFDQIAESTTRAEALFNQSERAWFVTIDGSQHMNFSDAGLLTTLFPTLNFPLGEIEPARALEIIGAYLIAFFDEHVRGLSPSLNTLPELYRESTLME